jgi:hypothetical protein
MYETGWTKLCWPDVPITAGTVVGVLGRHFGLWSLNACRIVYVIEEEASLLKRYGFAFGTLPGHVERGEERFTVEWHRAEDSVFYEVFVFARPTRWPVWAHRSCGWYRGGSRPPPCGPWLRLSCLMFPGRWVTDIISAATPFLKRSRNETWARSRTFRTDGCDEHLRCCGIGSSILSPLA